MALFDENSLKKYEGVCFKVIALGALMIAVGLGLSGMSPGLSVIAIYGGFLVFVFTVLLVLVYLVKDLKRD